ncbi:MAG: efflux RND transporter permease subunit [Thermodesulfobacteriota bacterium]|nr:MAG: efflux RND transporter permease subunit [Thermodesulfobacteriota bacterium]
MRIYEICIKRPVFATMLILSLVVMGLASYRDLGLDLFPKVELPTVTVTTRLEGASPEEIESQITKPIEEAVNTISGMDELRSTTIEGQSQVFATFILEKDVDTAANEVRDRVSGMLSQLPPGTEPPVIEKFDPDSAPIISIVVSGQRSAREVTEIADKRIKRQLESVKNVGAITLVGDRSREIQIVVDPDRLTAYGLSISEVGAAIRRQNVEVPGGRLTWESTEQGLRTMGRMASVGDFEDLIVADRKGAPVRIKDIARVLDAEEEPRTISRLDGKSAVSLLIRKQSGTNTVEVIDRVKEKIQEIEAALPADIEMQVVIDQSRFIKKAISQVEEHLVLGGLLASVIILIFIRNWRAALIAAIAIPASLISTFTIMKYFGFTLNNMTLLALTVCTGIVIDDAIIVLENIFRHMEEERKPPFQAAIEGTREIVLPVMATTLSLVVIFLPIAFMQGTVGLFWKSFGLTAAFAIMISLLVALTLTPMLSSRFLRVNEGKAASRDSKLYSMMEGAYLRLLAWCLGHRAVVMVTALAILVSIVPLSKLSNFEFLAEDDMSEFEVIVETPPGSSLDRSSEILAGVEKRIRAIPEVEHTFTTIGVRGQYRTNVTDSSIYVGLKPLEARERSQKELMQEARRALGDIDGLRVSVQNINLVSGGGFRATPFNMVLRGPELDKLDEYSGEIINRLKAIPGFVDTDTGQALKHPELQVHIDRQKASDLGVSVEAVAMSLRTMVGGEKVSLFREKDEQYNVRLRIAPDKRKDAGSIYSLTVPGSGGMLVSLDNVAELRPGSSPGQIDRYALGRQITIISNLHNKPLGEAVTDVNRVVKEMRMSPEYATSFLGFGKLMAEAFKNFMIAFVLSIIFIYMVLAAQFESFTHPVSIMSSIFLAIPFGILSLIISGSTVNIYSVMGMFILIGVVKKNGILQVDYTNTLRSRGMAKFEAQMQANKVRLRPILMTTLSIVAAMLPVTFGKGDGSAARASMAIVIVGGQMLSLIVTLVVVPVAYSVFDDLKIPAFLQAARLPWRKSPQKA